MNCKYRVDFWEHERGWGRRIDFQKFYDSKEDALNAIKEFNAQNTESTVPDWYMLAKGPYLVDLSDG